MVRSLWLPEVLKEAGLKVLEEPGWQLRGREMGEIQGVLCHHTAGPKNGNMPSLGTVRDGRPGLSGPLSQLVLARNGTYVVVAAGRCNHAGQGRWPGITDGNSHLIGIEAENTGYTKGKMADPWPEVQIDAYARGVAAILEYLKLPSNKAIGHKEWAPARKVDPTFDMNKFRERIGKIMAERRKRSFFFPDKEEGKVVETTVVEEPLELRPEDVVILPAPGTPADVVVTPPGTTKEVPVSRSRATPKVDPSTLTGIAKGVWAKDLLKSLGWTDEQAAALIGNAIAESNLDPKTIGEYVLEKKVVTKETPGAQPSSFGILKWDDKRQAHLDELAKELKKSRDNLELQVRFIDWELRSTEKRSFDELRASDNIMDSLRAAIGYVRPIGWTQEDPEEEPSGRKD